tara:strand:- start:73515 stop:76172 length:2658 start_codon:yes stop_codon:yes gene_type:complete
MKSKLLEITPQYNSFVDDQVLTSHQLNEFIEYFNEQDRLTRVCLSGVGLVCGFKITIDEADSITVSQGCGITTDGDLLKLQEDVEEASTKSTKDSKNIIIESVTFSHYKEFTDEKAQYAHFKNGSNTIDLVELIPEDMVDEEEHEPLSDFDLSDKVAILYLESYQKEPSICTSTNCDNQGQENVQNVKVLLASKVDVEDIINAKDPIFTKHNIFEAITTLPETAVPKVILNAGLGSRNNSKSYALMASAFKTAITTAKIPLQDAYADLFSDFSEILSIHNGTQTTVLNQINNLDDFATNEKVQYRYNLVKDISDSYNEILSLLLKLKTECCPNIEAFPKHLLLGCLFPSQNEYPELRHQWYPSPTNTEYETYIKKAKSLVRRVAILLDNFFLGNEGGLKITPSKSCGGLGEKAIPVYYNLDNSLLKAWNFQKTENYKQEYNLSYHTSLLASGWPKNPLKVSLECYDFFRIEGHFGRPGLASKDAINDIKNSNGLDFDCIHFNLTTEKDQFTAFVKKHPSIIHKAGVPQGGTFILISENDEVKADYCVSYKIPAEASEGGCCSLMECTYPWISSLKYMNNLSRSLKGTQSNNKPMPEDYVLQVIEYKINGEKLISGTTTIRIPLGQIFLRRMHAVTEALNNRFNKGLVFDFNESQKRFVITRAKEDTFVLRIREISMANNNATYTYSNNGMFRNNKVFRPDAMRCRDLKGYNPTFYEKLQAELAPVNKDDDYGAFNEDWRKWYLLRDRLVTNSDIQNADLTRMITRSEELPPEVRTLIPDIKGEFRSAAPTDVQLTYKLDGDWVTGVWVNEFMLDHYRANKKNTHDDIVLFINLRKKLHNETGVTKMSIYVQGVDYSEVFDEVIERYNTHADFYFGNPTGENAITL